MRKQNDKEDPLEDAIQKCKEEMQETINKINRNLLSTIKTLEDRVTAQDEEIARLKQELEVHSKNALEEGDCQPSIMEDHGVQALRKDLRAKVQALREEVTMGRVERRVQGGRVGQGKEFKVQEGWGRRGWRRASRSRRGEDRAGAGAQGRAGVRVVQGFEAQEGKIRGEDRAGARARPKGARGKENI
ncbi:hypothetical protein L7F22_056488 [Adiantum nelumboides]|nr:hypothetical protein [Adiantum nelumboides]